MLHPSLRVGGREGRGGKATEEPQKLWQTANQYDTLLAKKRSDVFAYLKGWFPPLEFSRYPNFQENAPRLQQEIEVRIRNKTDALVMCLLMSIF